MIHPFIITLAIRDIIFPTLLVGGIALVLGLILGVVSKVFAIPVDKLAEELNSVLPQANCGACGFAGCSSYAAYLSGGGFDTTLCPVGGSGVAEELSAILGLPSKPVTPYVAHVMCNGTLDNTSERYEYEGVRDCASADKLFQGPGKCTYGCIGYGDCIRICPYQAIDIINGIAEINDIKCTGCELCVASCPKNIIEMVPKTNMGYKVECRNLQSGGETRKICSVGCIGCQRCFKICPSEAIRMEGPLAVIDQDKCTKCGKCYEVCPTKSISGPGQYKYNVLLKERRTAKHQP